MTASRGREPPRSSSPGRRQGGFQTFRQRPIRHDMDRHLRAYARVVVVRSARVSRLSKLAANLCFALALNGGGP
jgi:hypothetical protein